jgi:hypothetical protein
LCKANVRKGHPLKGGFLYLRMVPAQKEALCTRAGKFSKKLAELSYFDNQSAVDLIKLIDDMIYALCTRLEKNDERLFRKLFREVIYSIFHNQDDEHFKEAIATLQVILQNYTEYLKSK